MKDIIAGEPANAIYIFKDGNWIMMGKIIHTTLALSLVFAINLFGQTGTDCTKSGCHDSINKKKFVHGPVGAGICNVCHIPIEGKDHKFQLFENLDELCFGCHETNRDMMLEENVHTPVAEGKCTGCHDPHQSDFRFTLKGEADKLCFQCHKEAGFKLAEVHGPVAVGNCNACHNPHASPNKAQLLEPLPQLCISCHTEKKDEMNKRHIHKPVEENCLNCHNPHTSANKFMLVESKDKLCFTCHTSILEFTQASHQHGALADGNCGNCHDSHSSDYPKMFPVDPKELCFTCHKEMEEFIASSKYKHGPVIDGDCSACHNPHGSEFPKILRKYFPEEFYIPYAEKNYDLCFECHNRTIATDRETTKLTDFRDGDLNLHFMHVNKVEKGRSCRACHQVHASNQQKHIRESVPFGKINWELPVKFTKRDDGGSCVVGCHGPKEYKR